MTRKKTKEQTIKYGGVELTVLNQSNDKVPSSAHEIKLSKDDSSAIAIGIRENLPILLIGETGTGKTSVVKHLACQRKQGYVRVSMTGYTTPDELIGSKSVKAGATYYEDGIITDAMKNGYLLVLDEINATPPDCSFILHGLLDDDRRITLPNGDIIEPHEDFRVVATMNPDYEGTKSINRALLDRFNIILNVDVLSPSKERDLIADRTGLTKEQAQDMVTVATMARKSYAEQKTITFVSTRTLLQWANLIKQGIEVKAAYIQAIANKVLPADKIAFMDIFHAVYKVASEGEAIDKPIVTTTKEIENYKKAIDLRDKKIHLLDEAVNNLSRQIEGLNSVQKKAKEIERRELEVNKKMSLIAEKDREIVELKTIIETVMTTAQRAKRDNTEMPF